MATPASQSKLLLYLLILVGAVGGYIYYSQVSSIEAEVAAPPVSTLDTLKELKLDFKALENEKYQALKVFGESPVLPGTTGKSDPFATF